MTAKQMQTWQYITQFHGDNGHCPTLQQIGEHFGLCSLASVHRRVGALVHEGLCARDPLSGRLQLLMVPVIGLMRLDQALRNAGEGGAVKLNGDVYMADGKFTAAEVQAVGWEVVA